MLSKIKSTLSQNLINLPGYRTKRKIVVIESDDWGSIRMPSVEVFNKFIEKGFNIGDSDYNRLDTIENNDDMTMLLDVLSSHNDSKGNPAVMTANIVVGNPDFKKIRESDFKEYFVEPVTETFKSYPGRDKVFSLWQEGYKKALFHPQFHGREHVNVVRWMEALRKKTPQIMFTFDCNTTFSGNGDYNFMEVLDYNTPKDMHLMKESLTQGLDMFETLFGFRSKSFIPPCYTWDSNVEETLSKNKVKYIQGLFVQMVPTGSFGNYTRKYHFLGSHNRHGQRYLVRNCFFEPSLTKISDPIGECLRRIDIAFKWNKPAIIGSHRINFMGDLDPQNRADNLKLLNELLNNILKKWPDVEFMTSDQLGDLMNGGLKNE
ncbi:hypothetical protein SAMN06265379_10241 [Saccharicrinis carchari]|uniref:Uncharacterized protein n=1 Tax=Saccharicrinis carchari TaxID=1168039 RepID=A0A521BSW1_SACCC|nr:hypothetical protein [Saccharicrinis carchari]SMO50248.1 hypothetical protein SAMN06265379_10241 [Saccharicrinis carchari]